MFFQEAHSGWRWILLALGLVTVVVYLMGWLNGRHYRKLDNRLGLYFVIAADIQLLLGLVLFVVLSPLTRPLFAGGNIIQDDTVRFYVLEHPLMMIVALVLIHVGRARQRRRDESHAKFRLGVIYYGLALALMLAGIRW